MGPASKPEEPCLLLGIEESWDLIGSRTRRCRSAHPSEAGNAAQLLLAKMRVRACMCVRDNIDRQTD